MQTYSNRWNVNMVPWYAVYKEQYTRMVKGLTNRFLFAETANEKDLNMQFKF